MDDKLGERWSEFGVPARTDFFFDEAALEHKVRWLVVHSRRLEEIAPEASGRGFRVDEERIR